MGNLAAEPVHGLVCQVARGLRDSGIGALDGVIDPHYEGIAVTSQETILDGEITTAAGKHGGSTANCPTAPCGIRGIRAPANRSLR